MIKYLKCVFFRELLNVLTDDEIRDILQLKIASIAKPVQVNVVFIQILTNLSEPRIFVMNIRLGR